jgi:hypothetical protein
MILASDMKISLPDLVAGCVVLFAPVSWISEAEF